MSHTSPSVSAAALSCTPSSHPSNPSHEIAGVNAISLEIRWCTDVRKSARTFSPARLRETCQVEAGLRYRALPRAALGPSRHSLPAGRGVHRHRGPLPHPLVPDHANLLVTGST